MSSTNSYYFYQSLDRYHSFVVRCGASPAREHRRPVCVCVPRVLPAPRAAHRHRCCRCALNASYLSALMTRSDVAPFINEAQAHVRAHARSYTGAPRAMNCAFCCLMDVNPLKDTELACVDEIQQMRRSKNLSN